MSLKSSSFVAAAEEARLQPVLEHRQRRGTLSSIHHHHHHIFVYLEVVKSNSMCAFVQ